VRLTMLFVFAAFTGAGCAARHAPSLADQFIHEGTPKMRLGDKADPKGAPEDSLAAYIDKVRQLSLAIRPAAPGTASTVEAANRDLAEALAREAAAPGADTHRAVGEIYLKIGVLDLAYAHFAQAIKANPRDAAAHDQTARVWRDWGFPQLGLSDAYQAIYYAPGSPSGYNTLGTLLQRLGQPAQALDAYRRALALAPDASYALNNVCSALLAMGKPGEALASCQRALHLDPALAVAQRNFAAAVAGTLVVSEPPAAVNPPATADLER
jgi:tetratricopeptide (TPR) repeat protein